MKGPAALQRRLRVDPAKQAPMVAAALDTVAKPLRNRLVVLARVLAPQAATAEGPELIRSLGAALDRAGDSEAWLTLATVTGELPVVEDVQRFRRAVRLDGAAQALTATLVELWSTALRRSLPEVTISSDVLVDLHTTSRTSLATGIQRVARQTALRWDGRHDLRMIGWADGLRALRDLTPAERQRALHGTDLPPQQGGRPAHRVVVPWRATYLSLELAADPDRTKRLAALARYSGSRTGLVGYDCIPITSAETTDIGVSETFAGNLAAVRYFDRIAAISGAAGAEYKGWRRMLTAIGVTGPGIGVVWLPAESPRPSDEALARARQRFVVAGLPLVLCVGTHEPRKNHLALLHAADLAWRAGHRFSLSFVGGHSWRSEEFFHQVAHLQAQRRPVDTVSGVDDDLLHAAYRLARCVAFPSLNEGFGLPVAESLAAGTPVLTSRYGSMAELADGGGVVVVDPRDDHDIAQALGRMVSDDELDARLRQEAAARPVRTWDDYARDLWAFLTSSEGKQ